MMSILLVVMGMVEYQCIHEDQIQGLSRKTAELEARADYKEKRIDELNDKINEMDKKMDKLLDGFNQFKLDSNKGDTELELRLKAIETEQAVMKEQQKKYMESNQRKLTNSIAVIGVVLTIITILINIYFH